MHTTLDSLVDIQGCIPWNHHHTCRVFSLAPNQPLQHACFPSLAKGTRVCLLAHVHFSLHNVKSLQAILWSWMLPCYTQTPSTEASFMFFFKAPFRKAKCRCLLGCCLAPCLHADVCAGVLEVVFSQPWFLDFILCVWLGLIAKKNYWYFYSSELLPSKFNCILILLRHYMS